nr:MAG TPA: protein of unknown function (DUF4376) [Caudoviricetes sp.]
MYYIHLIDDDGRFELIDGELLFLYDINADDLIAISDDDYQHYCQNHRGSTRFIDGKFVFNGAPIDPEVIKKQHQAQIWQAIKQKRHTITRGGVYVKSVKKWFHTDDSSRTQYLALQILPELPSELMWKTMDNSFVKLTKPLITELAMTILQSEQADFANAEKHRLAMLQTQNPLEYDYSKGWTAIYEQGVSNE